MYKVDTTILNRIKKDAQNFLFFKMYPSIAIIAILGVWGFCNSIDFVINFETVFSFILFSFCFLAVFYFPYLEFSSIREISYTLKKVQYLEAHGKLYKNLPYEKICYPEPAGSDGPDTYILYVDFPMESGTILTLPMDPALLGPTNETGLIDLLIDPNNPNIYFMSFNIEEVPN